LEVGALEVGSTEDGVFEDGVFEVDPSEDGPREVGPSEVETSKRGALLPPAIPGLRSLIESLNQRSIGHAHLLCVLLVPMLLSIGHGYE